MNKYCVAYLSLDSGEIKQEVVEANSKLEAAHSYLGFEEKEAREFDTMDKVHGYCDNSDAFINVLQVSNLPVRRDFPSGTVPRRIVY